MHFAKKKESKYHDIDSFSLNYFSLTKSKVIMKSGKMRGYQIQNYCQLLLTLSLPDLI